MSQFELNDLLKETFDHLEKGRFRLALSSASKLYKQYPDNSDVICCLAWAVLEHGSPVQSLEFADLAVKVSNGSIEARLYRGYLLMRMGIFKGALADLEYVISNRCRNLEWAMINKARVYGGLGAYSEGLNEIEKALKRKEYKDDYLLFLKNLFQTCLGLKIKSFSNIYNKNSTLFEISIEAFKQKEFWFVLWAAKEIYNDPDLISDHKSAVILELESLTAMFQIKAALKRSEEVKELFYDDLKYNEIYKRIRKLLPSDQSTIDQNKDSERTDLEKYESRVFNIYNARMFSFNLIPEKNRRNFLVNFDIRKLCYIGIEVIIDNPFFGNKKVNVNGEAVWSLNEVEIGRYQFNLKLERDWKIVEFVQSWGTDVPGYWKTGQGRVEIYLGGEKLCARWFIISNKEIKNPEGQNLPPLQKEKTAASAQHGIDEKPDSPRSVEELLTELNSLVGLNGVKQTMWDFVTYLKFMEERRKAGLKAQSDLSFHCVFLGNPGTGKTTIARHLGRILKAIGLLKVGHVVEVDRASLVGQYIGETAQKTDMIINEAQGGVLFIDEAYTLKKPGMSQDFGQEVIDTLLKRMEDPQKEFVVIAAGYPSEMETFINSNPGFKSRFTHFFSFDDFTPEEMAEIFKRIAKSEEYYIKNDALDLIKKEFTDIYRLRDKSFGNARLVKKYFNEAKLQLSKRLVQLPDQQRTKEMLTSITEDDIKSVLKAAEVKEYNLGINEEQLSKALSRLESLVGLDSVKKELFELVKIARYYIEQGENPQNKMSAHFVFLGNPGTGKTTVARLFSEIYSALGILPKGHLIEVDRQALVGSHVGETAIKTKEKIEKSLGGTLFIDEAYTLVKKGEANTSDFGQEAIDTLLKRMEDERGRFIVIAAGYTDLMNDFLESNPGIKSRFSKRIVFEDYTPGELLCIAENILTEKGFTISDDAKDFILKYFNKVYASRDKSFGNARVVRNLIEGAQKYHLLRLAELAPADRNENLSNIISDIDFQEIITQSDEKIIIRSRGEDRISEYISEIYSLTGIDDVKSYIEKQINGLKIANLRRKRGLKILPKNLHSLFIGNPGTGKSTVAALLGKIYKEMGILEEGHLIETNKAMLVSVYQGQTIAKTESVINKALGGILYVNDAPSLYKHPDDYGKEALDIIFRKMEEDENRFVVILAGNSLQMNNLLELYSALTTRFTNFFYFKDFLPRQMVEIAYNICEKIGYKPDEGAWQMLMELFTILYEKKNVNYENARTVKNILYKVIDFQEDRLSGMTNVKDEDLLIITYDDVAKVSVSDF